MLSAADKVQPLLIQIFLDLLFLPSDTLTCLVYFFCLSSLLAA